MLGFMNGIKKMRCSELFSVVAIACLMVILMARPAQATPLGLTKNDYPDILSSGITTSYIAGSDAFTANGWALTLEYNEFGDVENIINSGIMNFNITASIDNLGGLTIGPDSTLTIGGTVASLSFTSGTLLTGDLTAFGYKVGSETFEFLFDVTGGDADGLYGSTGLVLLHQSGFLGIFGSNFGTKFLPGEATADTGTPVPEPASMLLLLTGLIGLAGFRRKIQK